jgi:hypothetical protein
VSEVNYRKVKIRKQYCTDVAQYPAILAALQLSRLSNSLVTWLRIHLYVQRAQRSVGRLLVFKTRFDITLQHAAVLFEVLKTFVRTCDHLPRFRMKSFDLFQIEKWKRDFDDPENMISTILKPIRNKIAFHFDHELLQKLLSRFQFKDDSVFAIGKSELRHDAFYPAGDDLILNFIISRMPECIPEVERYRAFSDRVVEIAGDLSSLIDSIMLSLVRPYGYMTKEPL